MSCHDSRWCFSSSPEQCTPVLQRKFCHGVVDNQRDLIPKSPGQLSTTPASMGLVPRTVGHPGAATAASCDLPGLWDNKGLQQRQHVTFVTLFFPTFLRKRTLSGTQKIDISSHPTKHKSNIR